MTDDNASAPAPRRKPFSFSPEAVNEDVKRFIRENEDEKEFFYKDHKGNVTIGTGFMIPNEKAARELPLKINGRPASDAEKIEAYRRVKAHDAGSNPRADKFDPSAKNGLPNLRMDKGDISLMLDRRLRDGVDYLQEQFPDFASYPRAARKALQDMEFQIGPTKFKRHVKDSETGKETGWPKLFKAVEARDWATAAQESRRDVRGNDKENETYGRNVKTRQQFENAVLEERSKRRGR